MVIPGSKDLYILKTDQLTDSMKHLAWEPVAINKRVFKKGEEHIKLLKLHDFGETEWPRIT